MKRSFLLVSLLCLGVALAATTPAPADVGSYSVGSGRSASADFGDGNTWASVWAFRADEIGAPALAGTPSRSKTVFACASVSQSDPETGAWKYDTGCGEVEIAVNPALLTAKVDGVIPSTVYTDGGVVIMDADEGGNGESPPDAIPPAPVPTQDSTIEIHVTWRGDGAYNIFTGQNIDLGNLWVDLQAGLARSATSKGSITSSTLGGPTSDGSSGWLYGSTGARVCASMCWYPVPMAAQAGTPA